MNPRMRIAEVLLPETKEEISRRILSDLPEWFGIPEATEHYIKNSRDKYMVAVREGDEYVGFISLHEHNRYTAEIFVMGVLKSCQRRGYGKALIEKCVEVLVEQKMIFLTVKTLSSAHPDPNYTRTRHFYSSLGFLPLEEFPELWGKQNPCLMLVKIMQMPDTLFDRS
jgi:ribosomal protein S18 acetylase RimI-like enzyme